MFPKTQRLVKKKDFDDVFTRGKSIRASFLVGKALSSKLPESRFGFVVSKKVSLKATERNLIRRRLRATFFKALKNHPLPKAADVVVVVLPAAREKDFTATQKAAELFFKQLRLHV